MSSFISRFANCEWTDPHTQSFAGIGLFYAFLLKKIATLESDDKTLPNDFHAKQKQEKDLHAKYKL